MQTSGLPIFSQKTLPEVLGENASFKTGLSEVSRIVATFGGDLASERQIPLGEELHNVLLGIFQSENVGSSSNVIVLPGVGDFGVRLPGFDFALDDWSTQSLVIHRNSKNQVQITAFFSIEDTELFCLPLAPMSELRVRLPSTSVIVVDYLGQNGEALGGLGMMFRSPTAHALVYEKVANEA